MNITRMLLACVLAISAVSAQTPLENLLSPSRLPFLKQSTLVQISSNDTTGGNSDFIPIPTGATARLAQIQGPGVITMIWATIASNDVYFLRHIVLRMYWDGESDPSVEVPIGDFFGTGFQYKQFVTPFVGMSSGGYYCYFPMPFNKSARVEVVNETGQPISSFYYHIDYHKLPGPLDSTVAYFHATWHREIRTNPSHYYTLLEASGEGQLVGVNLNMQSYDGGLSFLEGDEMFYVDGEKVASVKGTGTEDYFNSGWYFNQGEFAAPYHGLILKDDTLGRIAAYRFHILDCVPFKKSIRALIEHGDRNTEVADYSSTAYWYQKEPHTPFAPMLPPGLRTPLRVEVPNGALEAESLKPEGTSLSASVEEMSSYGADWSSSRQMHVEAQKVGDKFSLRLPAPEGRYDIGVYYTKGPSYGDFDVIPQQGKAVAVRGFSATTIPGGKITLKGARAVAGEIVLQFVVKGKDASSTGYSIGLDAFAMQPYRNFIQNWSICGPFPNPRDASHGGQVGLDVVYPPEKEINLKKAYVGSGGQEVRWQPAKTRETGFLDLSLFRPSELVVAYAVSYISSPSEQKIPLLIGSDDGVKVFVNGKDVYRLFTNRAAAPDQDTVWVTLDAGWNTLLLKVENNFGGYGAYARFVDPNDQLLFRTTKQK
ncbi:MAG TPA: glycoside hydrolase family 172 protein [Bacteroidota bacterium]|nr:glycoside hydrolase family 172 protein [Bacteroidota bacterium]